MEEVVGEVIAVGRAFGVLRVKGIDCDFSVPRRDSKTGRGHRGFLVESDPNLSMVEAASRRDFTINAVMMDPLTGEVMDPFGGLRDLRGGILRHTSDKFAEDPLRVLRGMQLAARFDLDVASDGDETVGVILIDPDGYVFDSTLGFDSENPTEHVVPGLVTPGHRIRNGTRMPPS